MNHIGLPVAMAFLSMFAAGILEKRWMRWTAFGCAMLEVAMLADYISRHA